MTKPTKGENADQRMPSSVVVREVSEQEYEAAGTVTARAFSEFALPGDEEWNEYLQAIADVGGRIDRTVVLVAVDKGRVVGSVTIESEATIGDEYAELPPYVACLRMLGVEPSVRRRGVGRALVEAVIDRCRKAGKTELILQTSPPQHAAEALYRSLGFERDPNRDEPADDHIAYRLML
jgi:predicted N-acetyltransferase YhbS